MSQYRPYSGNYNSNYSNYRPFEPRTPQQQDNMAIAAASRAVRLSQRAEHMAIRAQESKGIYADNVQKFMSNVYIYSINRRIIFFAMYGKAYFGKQAYQMILEQAKYSGEMFRAQSNIRIASERLRSEIAAAKTEVDPRAEQKLPVPSFGLIPHTNEVQCFNIADYGGTFYGDFLVYLGTFILMNTAGLTPPQLEIVIGNRELYEMIIDIWDNPSNSIKPVGDLGMKVMQLAVDVRWSVKFPLGYVSWAHPDEDDIESDVVIPRFKMNNQ